MSEPQQRNLDRDAFLKRPRAPITVLLDRVKSARTIGTIFRLADAVLADRVVICRPKVDVGKRKLVEAAADTQRWVPWDRAKNAAEVVADLKAAGVWVVAAQFSCGSSLPDQLTPAFPACLMLGSDKRGLSRELLDSADAVVRVPMLGVGNALPVGSVAAILLHWLASVRHAPAHDRVS